MTVLSQHSSSWFNQDNKQMSRHGRLSACSDPRENENWMLSKRITWGRVHQRCKMWDILISEREMSQRALSLCSAQCTALFKTRQYGILLTSVRPAKTFFCPHIQYSRSPHKAALATSPVKGSCGANLPWDWWLMGFAVSHHSWTLPLSST